MFRLRNPSPRQPGLLALLFAALLPSAGWAADPEFPFSPIPAQVEVPQVADPVWGENPVDALVFAKLNAAGLSPAPEVDRVTYLRRVAFDLIGLPLPPEEVEAFAADPRADDLVRAELVDRLLASPQYGERMARLWLDVARYADTDGFAIDGERPTLWRYRDYVVRSFNNNKPFDQFIREQLAGDLLEGHPEGVIATGFYRLGPWEADNMTPEHRRQDFLNEMTSAIGSAFLGLTLGCARCHDHKYDPVPAADFYRIQAFLTPEDRGDRPAEYLADEQTPPYLRAKAVADGQHAEARAEFEKVLDALRAKLAPAVNKPASQITEGEIEDELENQNAVFNEADGNRFFEGQRKLKQGLGQRFQPTSVSLTRLAQSRIIPARILRNGDPFDPAEVVSPGFLSAIADWGGPLFDRSPEAYVPPERQRARLADWMASPQNPLVPRVFVNRIWQQLFGQGLVPTANDFGAAGSGVTNRDLLDHLARRFIDSGFNVKALQRSLLLSRAYRTATAHPDAAACAKVDADNRLLWRGPFRRLDAEGVRDALLTVSGQLNPEPGGPGFFEALPAGVETKYEFFDWPVSTVNERRRRSLYMFQRRNLVHPMMEVFDVADANQPCERRRPSVTAPQVLTLLNGELGHEAARALARRIEREAGTDPRDQVDRLFRLAFQRRPVTQEREMCLEFLREPPPEPASPVAPPERPPVVPLPDDKPAPPSPLARLCLVLLNSNEFLYLD